MQRKLKQILSMFLAINMILGNISPTVVNAQEVTNVVQQESVQDDSNTSNNQSQNQIQNQENQDENNNIENNDVNSDSNKTEPMIQVNEDSTDPDTKDPDTENPDVEYGGQSAIEFTTNITEAIANWEPFGKSCEEGDEITATIELNNGFQMNSITASLSGDDIELTKKEDESTTSKFVYTLTVPKILKGNNDNIIIDIETEFLGYELNTTLNNVTTTLPKDFGKPGETITLPITASDGYIVLADDIEVWLCEYGKKTEKINATKNSNKSLTKVTTSFEVPDKGTNSKYTISVIASGKKKYTVSGMYYDNKEDYEELNIKCTPSILYEGILVTVPTNQVTKQWNYFTVEDENENIIHKLYNTNKDSETFSMPASNVKITFYKDSEEKAPMEDVKDPTFDTGWTNQSTVKDEPEVKVKKSAAWTNIENGEALLNISTMDLGNVQKWPCDYIILVDCSATMRKTDAEQNTDRYNLAMNAINTLISRIEQANASFPESEKSQVAFMTYSGAEDKSPKIKPRANSTILKRKKYGADWEDWAGLFHYVGLTTNYQTVRDTVHASLDDSYRGSKATLALEETYNLLKARTDQSRFAKVIILSDENLYGYSSDNPGLSNANKMYLDAINNINKEKVYICQVYVGNDWNNDSVAIKNSYVPSFPRDNPEYELIYNYVNNQNGFNEYLNRIEDIAIKIYADNKVLTDKINTEYWDIVGIQKFDRTPNNSVPKLTGNVLTWNLGNGADTVEKTYSVNIKLKLKDKYRYLLSDTTYPTNIDTTTEKGCKVDYVIGGGKYKNQSRTVYTGTPTLKYGTVEFSGIKKWTVVGAEGNPIGINLNRKMPSQADTYKIDNRIASGTGWTYTFTNKERQNSGKTPLIKYDNDGKVVTYTITEQTPSFYTYLGQNITTANNHSTVELYNEPYKIKAKLTKVDEETGNKLSGAVFHVYQWSKTKRTYVEYKGSTTGTVSVAGKNQETGSMTALSSVMQLKESTTEKGVYTTPSWLYYTLDNEGKFRIIETTAPTGYFGDFVDNDATNAKNVYDFSIKLDGSNNTKTIDISNQQDGKFGNQRTLGAITFNKYDKEANANISQGDATLSDAVYKLYAAQDIIHQDQSGTVLYKAGEEIHLVANGTTRDGYNKYTYKDKKETTDYTDIVTGKDGGVYIDELEIGRYCLKEQSAGEGYLKNDIPIYFEVTYKGENIDVVQLTNDDLTNEKGFQKYVADQVKKQKLKFYKITGNDTDSLLDPLENAKFSVYLVSDLEGGKFKDYDDEKVAQTIIDNYRDTTTLLYSDLKKVKPATVYDESNSEDVTSGKLVKSITYNTGETVTPKTDNPNAYVVAELSSNAKGIVEVPSLPYGRYVVVETTVPEDRTPVRPFIINVKADDNDKDAEGDGKGTKLDELVIAYDKPIMAYVRIKKVDSQSHNTVLKSGVEYLIHDRDKAYYNYFTADTFDTDLIDDYKKMSQNGELVVMYSSTEGIWYGTEEHPFITRIMPDATSTGENVYIQTPQQLPPGAYELEELTVPDGYIQNGKEGVIAKDTNNENQNHTFFETEENGMWTETPKDRAVFVVSSAEAQYDRKIYSYVVEARQQNDPAIGKISIYTEGEHLVSAQQEGSTILTRLANRFNTFFGYLKTLVGIDDANTVELDNFKDYVFTYENGPVEGATYEIRAKEDIVSQEGGANATTLFKAGDLVCTLVSDKNGETWTGQDDWDGTDIAKGLPLGKYTITQVKAGSGFSLTDENKVPKEVEISYAGQTVPVVYKDTSYEVPRQKVHIEVTKKDRETNDVLSGAVFGLYANENILNNKGKTVIKKDTLIATAETSVKNDEVVNAVFAPDLPLANYYVKEISAPKGYVTNPAKTEIPAIYNEDQRTTVEFNETYTNIQSKLQVNLMDYYTEEELDGAQLYIADEDGNEFTTVISVHDNNVVIRGLEVNKSYTLKEIVSSDGYHYPIYLRDDYVSPYVNEGAVELTKELVKDKNDTITFTIQDIENLQILSIFNKPITGTMTINKTGNVATGFANDTDKNGNKISTPVYEIKSLPNAEYVIRVKENIDYPDGYTGRLYNKGDLVLERTDIATNDKLEAFHISTLKGTIEDVSPYIGIKYDKNSNEQEILAFYNQNNNQTERQIPSEEELTDNKFYYTGTSVKTIIKTDNNGEASISGLPIGEYEVIEVQAPEGYTRNIQNSIKNMNIQVPETSERPEAVISTSVDFENSPLLPADPKPSKDNRPKIVKYNPSIEIIKKADKKLYEPNETVHYQITVINTGDCDLKDIHVTDSLANGEIKTIETLKQSESVVFDYEYVIPEDAVAGSKINNTVIVTGTPDIKDPGKDNNGNPIVVDPSSYEPVSNQDTEKVSVTGKDIIVQKTADKLIYKPGETAVYHIDVLNPNNYDLTNVKVADNIGGTFVLDKSDGIRNDNGTVIIDRISANGTVSLIYKYQIPKDATAGEIENIVIATGNATEKDSDNPEIKVEKTVEKHTYKVGDTANYTITVKNSGNVDLTNVKVTDTLNGTFLDSPEIGDLKVGESRTLKYEYVIQNKNNGDIVNNTAIAEGTSKDGDKVKDSDSEEIIVIDEKAPAIHIEKIANKHTVKPGEEVIYTLEVKNTGNVDLTNVKITDDRFDLGEKANVGNLAIGEIKLINYIYTIPADATDTIVNTATVEGTDKEQPNRKVKDESEEEIKITTSEKNPAIKIVKVADKHYYEPGDTATYQIKVYNVGNVDLQDISVSDKLTEGEWLTSPTIDYLAVGESKELTFIYEVPMSAQQGDKISNEATVKGKEVSPDGTTPKEVTDKDDEEIEIIDTNDVHISISKVAEKHNYKPNETVKYKITVKNDGSVDLKNVSVKDSLKNGKWISDPEIGSLKVGESVVLDYEYKVPSNALGGDEILNEATVTGTDTKGKRTVTDKDDEKVYVKVGPEVSDEDNETIIVRDPKIKITKTVDKQVYYKGETATYTITVKNTGNTKLQNVVVNESILTDGTFISSTKGTFDGTTATIGDLDINEEVILKFNYMIKDDAESGTRIDNVVFVNGKSEDITDPHEPNEVIPGENVSDRDEEEIYVETIPNGLSITKYGIDDGLKTGVANAEFTIYAKENITNIFGTIVYPAGTEIETTITGENGIAYFTSKLPIGTYIVKETKAPDGYYTTNKEITWNSKEWQYADEKESYSYHDSVENAITELSIKLIDDRTYNKLKDAILNIMDEDGNVIKTWITKTDDGYVIKGLTTNKTYTITETTPRDRYLSEITDAYNNGNNIELKNRKNNQVSFVIKDITTNTTTDGSIDKDSIPEKTEITLTNPFVIGEVQLTKDGEMLDNWTLVDKMISYVKSLFGFSKKNLEGVEFTIYAKEDIIHPDGISGIMFKAGDIVSTGVRSSEKQAIETTDASGIATFKELYLGKYVMKETKTIDGFNLDVQPKDLTFAYIGRNTSPVKATIGDIQWTNERQKVHIEITKRDQDTNKPVAGAVFELHNETVIKNANGNVIVQKGTLLETSESDDNGIAVFESDLPLGKYYVIEQTAPKGYTLSNDMIQIDASYRTDTNIINVNKDFFNEITKVRIEKYAEDTNELLKGATLAVYHNNDLIEQWITDGKPHEIRGLLVGETYTLKEIKPSDGYTTVEDITFTVMDRNPKTGEYKGQTIKMTDPITKVELQKLDKNDTKVGIEGATIEIYDSNNKLVRTVQTGKDGRVMIEKLPVGTYTWKETKTPNRYSVNPNTFTFTIENDGTIKGTTVFEDDYVRIGIVKLDKSSKNKLAGAEFTLYDNSGNAIVSKTTDESGRIEFNQLKFGTYTIKETKAPSGYQQTKEVITVVVNEEFINKDFEVLNTKAKKKHHHKAEETITPTTPQPVETQQTVPTGDMNQLWLFVISGISSLLSILYLKRKKEK